MTAILIEIVPFYFFQKTYGLFDYKNDFS